MKITNTQPGPRGVNTVAGTVLVEPGQTIEADVYEREREHIEATGWFDTKGDYAPNPGGAAAAAPATDHGRITDLERQLAERDARIAELEKKLAGQHEPKAVHRGGGSYSVMQGEVELADKLTRDEAEKFNAMSAEDKAKFVAAQI